jgi:threonylcarbamoyladenosine tRNA methylthiotransferase MtaB
MRKIAFYTLGCKVNQADTASMEEIFRKAGYEIVQFNQKADVYLINTCVVTNNGQRRSRQIINRAVRNHPLSLTVVTGCYPQTAPEEVKAIEGVDVIIGNQERGRIVELVELALDEKRTEILDNVQKMTVDTKFEELGAGTETDKTRAFLKIQEGCNQYCTYCIIPYARGPLRSRTLDSIKAEVTKLVAAGYKEVVLIGIHLGCYGKEQGGEVTLYDAVQAALSVNGLKRLRLGSLESVEVDPRIVDLMARDNRLCRHLHLPLQSGCDKILKAMHRPYDTARYGELLRNIKEQLPDIAITTDCLAGFVGETEEDFLSALAFIEKIGYTDMHIFPYSRRKGTIADNLEGHLDKGLINDRAKKMQELAKKMAKNYRENYINTKQLVLVEQNKNGKWIGHTTNYLEVAFVEPGEFTNKIVLVEITNTDKDVLDSKFIKEVNDYYEV